MSLESKIDEKLIIAENEKKVNVFLANNPEYNIFMTSLQSYKNIKRRCKIPTGHNSSYYSTGYLLAFDTIMQSVKTEKDYLL